MLHKTGERIQVPSSLLAAAAPAEPLEPEPRQLRAVSPTHCGDTGPHYCSDNPAESGRLVCWTDQRHWAQGPRVHDGRGMLRDKNMEIRLFRTAVMAPAYRKSLPEIEIKFAHLFLPFLICPTSQSKFNRTGFYCSLCE